MNITAKPEYRYVFGPVPSRRLGLSLGVDLMPHKTCTLDCVYCECGKTTHLTLHRKEYTPVDQVRRELDSFLSSRPELDFITFSGSGEPTLHSGIGAIIEYLKSEYPEYAIAVLTNGTLLYDPEVRKSISRADRVVTSIDAATESVFQTINRPHPGLDMDKMVAGITAFRKEYAHQFWLEIFIVPGQNDGTAELKKIQKIADRVEPHQIQINSLDRPGTEDWVQPLDRGVFKNIQACMHNVSTIDSSAPVTPVNRFSGDMTDRILSTVKRRPCTAEDISKITGAELNKINQHLDILLKNGEVVKKIMPRGTFFFRNQ